jgi:hypothetical protein
MAVNNPTNSQQALGTTDTVTHGTVYVGTTAPTNVQEVSIQRSVAGTIGVYVYNANAGGGSRETLSTNGTGDAWTNYNIFSVTDWSIGLDNSDGDKFKISANATLGTLDAITIDPSTQAVTIVTTLISTGGQVAKITAPGAYPYNILTTDYIVSIDTSLARTIRLPNAPTTGQIFVIKDVTGSAAANNISLTTVGGAVTIDGATTKTLNVNYASVTVYFNGTSYFII